MAASTAGQLRKLIAGEIRALPAAPAGHVLHAGYGGQRWPGSDVENLLLNNIDQTLALFRRPARLGIRFEDLGPAAPAAPDGTARSSYYRYQLAGPGASFAAVQPGHLICRVPEAIVPDGGARLAARVWLATRTARPESAGPPWHGRFLLRVTLHLLEPATSIKAVIDGVTAAMQRDDAGRINEAITRLAGLQHADAAELLALATSVYLSVLARSTTSTLADVSAAMYGGRTLVRWMAMRRTLFLLPRPDVPVVQAAVSTPLAAVLRRRLVSQLIRNGTEPPVRGDLETWLSGLQGQVEHAVRARGSATGAELAADVPALRTLILPRAASDRPQNVTSALLTMMSAHGRIVRGTPTGPWTSRHHRWEPAERWWPDGLPELAAEDSQRELARRWLARFGPATAEDLQWWTGWNKTTLGRALRELPVENVDLHGDTGIALAGDDPGDAATAPPTAALLPALDPTPMGWKRRDWLFGIPQHHVFDNRGNIGPTLWWDGEIIGSWAVTPAGEVRTALLADRGATARSAVQDAAARLVLQG